MDKIVINTDNGRVLISAGSHWGKTYLSCALLNKFLEKGWKVKMLIYTMKSESKYWTPYLNNPNVKITEASQTDLETLISFLSTIEGNEVIFIDDLDLYLKMSSDRLVKILKNLMSAIRKANVIFIYQMKSLKGKPATDLMESFAMAFIGKFSSYYYQLDKLGIDYLQDKMKLLNKHDFILYIPEEDPMLDKSYEIEADKFVSREVDKGFLNDLKLMTEESALSEEEEKVDIEERKQKLKERKERLAKKGVIL